MTCRPGGELPKSDGKHARGGVDWAKRFRGRTLVVPPQLAFAQAEVFAEFLRTHDAPIPEV